MNIGHCCICLSDFNASNFATLGINQCCHTFHYDCIVQWVVVGGSCPQCMRPATVQDVKRMLIHGPRPSLTEAVNKALAAYDSAASTDGKVCVQDREKFQDIIEALATTVESRNEDHQSGMWDNIKKYAKIASVAALAGLFVFLCYSYWPVFSTWSLSSLVFKFIQKIGEFFKNHCAEVVVVAMGGLLASKKTLNT